MSLVKNVSGGPLDVPLLDREVADGETVEVPDFQPGHVSDNNPAGPGYDPGGPVYNPLPIVWPPDKWQPADPPKVKPEKTTGTTTISASGEGKTG